MAHKKRLPKYQGFMKSETMPDSHLWEGAQSERSPDLDDYGNIPSEINFQGDQMGSGYLEDLNSYTQSPDPELSERSDFEGFNIPYISGMENPFFISSRPQNILGRTATKAANIFRRGDRKRPTQSVRRFSKGGEVLNSFKSAARFDQPNFKNGRRTKG